MSCYYLVTKKQDSALEGSLSYCQQAAEQLINSGKYELLKIVRCRADEPTGRIMWDYDRYGNRQARGVRYLKSAKLRNLCRENPLAV